MGSVPDLLFTAKIALASKGSARYTRAERLIAIGTVLLAAWLLPGAAQVVKSQEAALRTGPIEVADSPALGVEFKSGLLSIEARQSPLTEVLNAVREKTGIRFNCSLPLARSVTVSFMALPVKQALERLFGSEANFMFRYPEGRLGPLAVPQEVWVLGKVQGAGSEPRKTGGGEDKAAPSAEESNVARGPGLASEGTDSTGDNAAAEDGALDLNDVQVIDHLVELARDEDPATRVQALSTLASGENADEGAVESALDAALTDKDPTVRGTAVQALASRRGVDAIVHLRQALADPDPGVRIVVVENAVPQGQGLALLREALFDADEIVRTIAADRLKQGEKQRTD
ncbi:MAG: HEAT repeat domain-containing protein [Gammaproteobacteria bacterium]